MKLRSTFQSLISLHQEELPYNLIDRKVVLPIDSGKIITVTGIRRCGKSSLLGLAMNSLLKAGVPKERILYIGFDDERFASMGTDDFDEILQAYREMYPENSLEDVYLFFDEIQLIDGWELFVLRVYKNYCRNIFITGSTAKMLSEEMASALRGWPDEYKEYPLSFEEYLIFKGVKANKYSERGKAVMAKEFREYCREGGFPQVVLAQGVSEKTKLLQSYFNTMLFRDMIEHYNITTPPAVVRYFLKRVMSNLTKPTSINNIFNELKSLGMKVSKDSLYQWAEYACSIFLFCKVPKYGRSLVKETAGLFKYYMTDIGLRNAVLLSQSSDEGKCLENIVYMALERSLGEDDKVYYYNEDKECDFIVQRNGSIDEVLQVCWELDDDNYQRETGGLIAAAEATKCRNCKIITYNQEKSISKDGYNIDVIPVWNFTPQLSSLQSVCPL